jgi:hypothetical protein
MEFPKAVYFHEDDYCQIEILPLSLWTYCVDEMKKIEEFSDAHKLDLGWSDIYIREELPESLAEFSISLEAFKKGVEETLTPYRQVSTGYSSHVEECRNCFAWGLADREFTIFADIDSENSINNIWLEIGCLTDANLPPVLDVFNNLPRSNDLMIADWRWSKAAQIADKNRLRSYLALHRC